jgi:sugar (pentulose or hexulose) kinase
VPEATAVGAALLAGLAIGVFAHEQAAARSVACDHKRYEPDAQRAAQYDRLYREAYLPLYPALKRM